MKATHIKVLLVEDLEFDVEAIVRALQEQYDFVECTNVASRREFVKALDADYDLIISDHKLPDFDSFDAFEILRASGKDIPFIIISGTIDEDRAAEALKKGVADFLSKNSFTRLGSATREALENRRLRQANQKTRSELSEAQERLRLAMESTNVGTWDFWPADDRLSFCARSAAALQINDSSLSFTDFLSRVAESDQAAVRESLRSQMGISIEFRLRSQDNWLCLKGKAHFNAQGEALRMIGILLDVSEQKEKEHQWRAQSQRSEAVNRAKSTFLANMSHEIRTPLGVILGYADLLLNPSDNAPNEQEQFLQRIIKNGRELSQLIDDILDLSKVEEGRMEMEKKSFDVFELIHDITTSFQLKIQEKSLELTCSITADVPRMIFTDPKRLRQILVNIVGNAVKFTEHGSVHLIVSAIRRPDRPQQIAFKITDSGIGIGESRDLFQPFHQEDASTTRRFGGTGLGLSLSQALARTLGGDIVLLESTAGRGSTFLITIESERPATKINATPVIQAAPKARLPLQAMKILVVDDSTDNQLLIKRILQRSGAEVTTVGDGEKAVQEGTRQPYDAILMDMQMPILDGYSATRRLRSLGVKIPIVALTAHAMCEEMQRSLAAGCTAHLTKPIDKSLLLNTLAGYVEQQG